MTRLPTRDEARRALVQGHDQDVMRVTAMLDRLGPSGWSLYATSLNGPAPRTVALVLLVKPETRVQGFGASFRHALADALNQYNALPVMPEEAQAAFAYMEATAEPRPQSCEDS